MPWGVNICRCTFLDKLGVILPDHKRKLFNPRELLENVTLFDDVRKMFFTKNPQNSNFFRPRGQSIQQDQFSRIIIKFFIEISDTCDHISEVFNFRMTF